MRTTAVTIHVPNEFHAILNEFQQNTKQGIKKKVALSEILLDFAKIGMQKEQKSHSTKNKNIDIQEKEYSTQNFERFTQDLIVKPANYDLNFTNRKEIKKRSEELKLKEGKLKEREAELKQGEEDLLKKWWQLVSLQEEVNSKLYETREKDLIISQKDSLIKHLSNEIVKINTQYQNETADLKNEIIELKRQKDDLLLKLDGFETILKNVEHSNNRQEDNLQSFISKSQEKTVFDYIEPFLPALTTFAVLYFQNNKNENKVKTLKKELLSAYDTLDNEIQEKVKKKLGVLFLK